VSRRRAPLWALLCGAVAVVIAACGPSAAPQWQPQQTLGPEPIPHPQLTGPPLIPGPGGGSSTGPGQPSGQSPTGSQGPNSPDPTGSGSTATDPAVVASNLASPTGVVVMPDGTALVGERTTGRIVRVQPVAGRPVTQVAQLDGIDASGDGGLLDLALSPTYAQDGMVLAYITTATDNRVVHFTLGGVATPILTGIPKGATGNVGRLAFDQVGHLYVATGDAGNAAAAADPGSLAGKILRVDDVGRPLADNPNPASPVWATAPGGLSGLCVDASNGTVYAAGNTPDAVYQVQAGAVLSGPGATPPAATLPPDHAQAGGCAIGNQAVYVATGNGQALISASLASSSAPVGQFSPLLQNRYGRLRTVVSGTDGALWLTTDNLPPDGTAPAPTDDRVIRILDTSGGGAGSLV